MSDETFSRILVLLLAVSVGYVFAHRAVERLSRRFTFTGGIEYVLLGIVLGPVLGLLGGELARDIRPVLLLGAGALGMLAGLELGTERHPELSARAWLAAGSIAFATALMVLGVPLVGAWLLGYDIEGANAWTGALLATAVVALGSDSTPIRVMANVLGARGPAPEVGILIAHRVRAIATIGLGVFYAVVEKGDALLLRDPLAALEPFGIQLGAGVILGLLFGVVVHRKLDDRTLLTIVVGMIFLCGGFAYAMGVSAIFVNFIAGLTFARTSPHSGEGTRMMTSIKQPFVIALYFFAGLEWLYGQWWVFGLLVPFLLLRYAGRRLGGFVAAKLVHTSSNLGPATFSPGGLSIAFVLSIGLVFRKVPGVQDAYGPLLTGLVLLELGSLRAVRRWLVDVADVPSERAARSRLPASPASPS